MVLQYNSLFILIFTGQNQNFQLLRAFGIIFTDWSCDSSHFLTNGKNCSLDTVFHYSAFKRVGISVQDHLLLLILGFRAWIGRWLPLRADGSGSSSD
ncbi:unnamed protein product [Rhizophagus irregularis]|nr:unnamed protein product [Rhizophagus irregularis]